MTDRKELEALIARMREAGATVHTYRDREGRIDAISIADAAGFDAGCMGPLHAAERMRAFLAARPHVCDRAARWPLHDARGIFCCYVCEVCEADKRRRYRADIFTDANYWHDEPIEGDY